jgi:hypothetical protein
MGQLTQAVSDVFSLFETEKQARAARQTLEAEMARSTAESKGSLEKQLRLAIVHHIQAMRNYDNAIVQLACLVCQKLWIPPYDRGLIYALDAPSARSNESAMAAWLHEQLASTWPTSPKTRQRRLLHRVIDTLRRRMPEAACGDVDEILNNDD